MNFIIWVVIGGLIGWVASMIMRTDAQQGLLLNVVVGIIGALLGGWLLAPLFGTGTINQNDFSLGSLIVSLLGAVILLAVVNLFQRGKTR
jgi:uncharacterized membrane protein YeaQ/YmgE (transglycosylase-associated protein family)